MSRVLFILTLFALLLNIFSKGVILLSFELNRDFIARNLCVQKDNTDNCCKGSCQLKKQMSADEEKEAYPPFQNIKDKVELLLFYEADQPLIFAHTTTLSAFSSHFLFPLSFGENKILHPPPQS